MLQQPRLVDDRPTPYATSLDFCRTFTAALQRLYLLSLLLTADNDKAEQCFIRAMEECGEGIGVFTDWACSWAWRTVITRAIRMIRPAPEHPDRLAFISPEVPSTSAENSPLSAVFALSAFELFVYVISLLEGQSERNCVILLRFSRRDLMIARVLPLTH